MLVSNLSVDGVYSFIYLFSWFSLKPHSRLSMLCVLLSALMIYLLKKICTHCTREQIDVSGGDKIPRKGGPGISQV